MESGWNTTDWGTVDCKLKCGCTILASGAVDWRPGDKLKCDEHGWHPIVECDDEPTYGGKA